ncbi:MAG: protein kinase [Cyanobacteria bacterium SZAS LIN-3]|nr:protein kinase [Cyanobacteria bacterium SZAS LIN-3]MBS2007352.1 protein kinase [Cyanobacteria bacterium SZAS TMP-1]
MSRTFILQDNGSLLASDDPQDSALPLLPGTVIDSKYEIISLVGQGGMGSVYRAHHLFLDKDMALKTFRSRKIDLEASQRFEVEVRAVAKLSHKNIVQVFDFGMTADGRPFYTMELLTGSSLVKHIARHSLSLRETLEIFKEVAEGLAHAHNAGIIHRDIKPDNIHLGAPTSMAGKISSVKIVDFGIAKLAMESNLEDQTLTRAGRVFGSPLYMSPEQSIGQPTDHTTDIYSFGCTLFEAITGRPPFVGKDSSATLACHRLEQPPTLAGVAPDRVFPQRLEALVARLLEKDTKDRFQSFLDVRQEIKRILARLPEGPVSEEASIARQAETSLLSNNAGQAKTDPLIAADRAISRAIEANRKLILQTTLAGLAGLIVVVGWLVLKGHSPPATTKTAPANPVNANASSSKPAPIKKYLVRQTATEKIFNFPLGEPIGRLHFHDTEVPATGKVVVPTNCDLDFIAQRPIAQDPQLLEGFGPNDLTAIDFVSNEYWKDRHLKWVAHLTGLHSVNVGGCDLTAASIAYLSNISSLRRIYFDGLHITADQWCGLKQLPQLTDINCESLQNCSALLTKLKQKNSLESLEIKGSDLSDATITSIASFKKLRHLKLVVNTVTSKGLKSLLVLPKLDFLCISNRTLGPDSIEIFAAMPALRELEVQTGSWGEKNQGRLQQLMVAKGVKVKQTCPMPYDGR